MKRRLFLMSIAGMAGCTPRSRPRLNVFNWSNYVAPETIPTFEREFGARVRYAVYESNEEMLARVMSGNSGWDVVFPSNYFIRPMRAQGLLAPLRHGSLRNLDHLDPRFRSPSWDPPLAFSVPYMWGATGIICNRKVTPPPDSWASLWEERLRGRMTMLDDPAEVLGAALKKLGYPLNSTDPVELRRAQREAIAQKRLLRAYLNAEVRDQLVAGDVLAAQLWSNTSQQAMDASARLVRDTLPNKDPRRGDKSLAGSLGQEPAGRLAFVYPAEGFALYADNAVILRESRRQELAHRFIDFLLRPDVAAAVARAVKPATANASARALLEEPLRNSPTLYPPPDVLRRGEWFETLPKPAQRLRDRLWTEIKSA